MRNRIASLVVAAGIGIAWPAWPAGAQSTWHAHEFVGRYRITAFPADAPEFHTTWHVHADGTVVDHGLVAHWSNRGKVFTMTVTVGGATTVLTGVRTAHGISRADHPGTSVQNGALLATWYGRELPAKEAATEHR